MNLWTFVNWLIFYNGWQRILPPFRWILREDCFPTFSNFVEIKIKLKSNVMHCSWVWFTEFLKCPASISQCSHCACTIFSVLIISLRLWLLHGWKWSMDSATNWNSLNAKCRPNQMQTPIIIIFIQALSVCNAANNDNLNGKLMKRPHIQWMSSYRFRLSRVVFDFGYCSCECNVCIWLSRLHSSHQCETRELFRLDTMMIDGTESSHKNMQPVCIH